MTRRLLGYMIYAASLIVHAVGFVALLSIAYDTHNLWLLYATFAVIAGHAGAFLSLISRAAR